jgi:anaerobic ribonucleoside-triphosphate reductase
VGKIAAVANIQKAFLQIKIRHQDRDALRFLWLDQRERLFAYRMTSVPFGATCSTFLLAVVLRHYLLKHTESNSAAKKMIDRIYVDDVHVTASDLPK